MGSAARFAIAILIFFAAMLLLFLAFHPNGQAAAQNPDDVLSWLIGEFQGGAAGTLKPVTSPTNANPGTPSPPASPAAGGA